jgi:hypothetical protein
VPVQTVRGTVRNHYWLILVSILLAVAAGCTLPAHVRGPSWIDCLRAGAPLDPNAVLIETALIERPAGDAYICHELWQDTDELIVGLERRDILQENGLRVGQLVGAPPTGFQTLLLSPRSCTNPARLMVPSGKLIPQYLGPVLAHCAFDVDLGTGATEIAADQIRFGFDVMPTLTADGRTRLVFTPKVETGENLLPFQASPEDASWVLRIERPSRKFPELSWDVTLAPGQYLIIGCRPEKERSLGASAFIQENGPSATQRLLVIRTNRAGTTDMDLTRDELLSAAVSPPLALQATLPTQPGTGH